MSRKPMVSGRGKEVCLAEEPTLGNLTLFNVHQGLYTPQPGAPIVGFTNFTDSIGCELPWW